MIPNYNALLIIKNQQKVQTILHNPDAYAVTFFLDKSMMQVLHLHTGKLLSLVRAYDEK